MNKQAGEEKQSGAVATRGSESAVQRLVMATFAADSAKDLSELRDIADWFDAQGKLENATFLRAVADGMEEWAKRIDAALHVLTPICQGGDAGGASWWDGVRARNILKGIGDPNISLP